MLGIWCRLPLVLDMGFDDGFNAEGDYSSWVKVRVNRYDCSHTACGDSCSSTTSVVALFTAREQQLAIHLDRLTIIMSREVKSTIVIHITID
jgi:hypothetical protein